MKPIVTQERLKEVLSYDPATGIFRWKKSLSNKRAVGEIAGVVSKRGCIVIGVDTKQYKAHRLAFLYVRGEWPANKVDHRDGDPTNNAWENLRDVTQRVNTQNFQKARVNSKTGFLGVSPANNGFKAQVTINGKTKNLGIYKTPQEAYEVYLGVRRKIYEGNTL
jgi:hypothetical protein